MFTLIGNLFEYFKNKRERKLTFVVLGLDNAGKTTLLKSLQGDSDQDVSPTFGFGGTTVLKEGQYTVSFYDVGGGKQIRRIWKTFLPEIHGTIFVVDASEHDRFEEARSALEQTLADVHLSEKPVLVFANKQDLPTAATAPQVASGLGLGSLEHIKYNILPCIAKLPHPSEPDARIRAGLRWLVSSVDAIFSKLNPRVMKEAEVARHEEEKRKQEREERARKLKEERLRKQKDDEVQGKAAFQDLNTATDLNAASNEDPLKSFTAPSHTGSQVDLAVLHTRAQTDWCGSLSSGGSLSRTSEVLHERAASLSQIDDEKEKQRWHKAPHNKIVPYVGCPDPLKAGYLGQECLQAA